ncbi:Pumilio-family RNA binding repeat [Carpediemonas membranifera]|uniref:Pumilio-family RNA binding repeat n=1 Tax=Carpediemonas membranifera TaxID=201153 RepID=A0A8J6DXG3_9EUKA|nr:Pumilio-family RNA binding repeat [Carpediemonas membranifera]|eukprot:KAG9390084.1 Pumilio-family RNA binding repeat [Carpediemonas membranifera]
MTEAMAYMQERPSDPPMNAIPRPLSAPGPSLSNDDLLHFASFDADDIPEDLRTHELYDQFYREQVDRYPDLPPPLCSGTDSPMLNLDALGRIESPRDLALPMFTNEYKDEMLSLPMGSLPGSLGVFTAPPSQLGRVNNTMRPQFDKPAKSEELSVVRIVGQVSSIARDQAGCRELQDKLKAYADSSRRVGGDYFQIIYNEAREVLTSLMVDPFGNYLCQKLFEVCTAAQRQVLLDEIHQELHTISLNMHGTRSVQKLIEAAETDLERQTIIEGLRPSFVTLIKDLNGNHCIQKCLTCFPPDKNQLIFDAAAKACVEIAVHQHGCCVYQRCIDAATPQQRARLVDEVIRNSVQLIQDSYGNYVSQYVIQLDHRAADDIVDSILHSTSAAGSARDEISREASQLVMQLATQKFSSNVLEKCLEMSTAGSRSHLVDAIIGDPGFIVLLSDPYGNYVIQKAMPFCNKRQFKVICDAVERELPTLRASPFAKRIIAKCGVGGGAGMKSPERTPVRSPGQRGRRGRRGRR